MSDHLTDAELDDLDAKAKAYAQGGITGAGQRLTDFREAANPTTGREGEGVMRSIDIAKKSAAIRLRPFRKLMRKLVRKEKKTVEHKMEKSR